MLSRSDVRFCKFYARSIKSFKKFWWWSGVSQSVTDLKKCEKDTNVPVDFMHDYMDKRLKVSQYILHHTWHAMTFTMVLNLYLFMGVKRCL